MRNNSMLTVTAVVSFFILAVIFGVTTCNLTVNSEAAKAKCNSVGGHYGGGKCFIGGVEIDNA